MKVVLFCGGQGLRMRSGRSDDLPKPMVPLGIRPILWHLMKYYAYWGHKDFILCLGYKGASIKQFFVAYEEWISNDFVLTAGGRNIELMRRDKKAKGGLTFVLPGANGIDRVDDPPAGALDRAFTAVGVEG